MLLHIIASRRDTVGTNSVKSILHLTGDSACKQSSCAPSYRTSFSEYTMKELKQVVK